MFMRRRAASHEAADGDGAHGDGAHGNGAHGGGKRAARRPAGQARGSDEQNERIATREQQAQHPPRPVPKPTVLAELSRLAKLHREGALSDAEFAAARAKLLT
jgi:hypothetical protein